MTFLRAASLIVLSLVVVSSVSPVRAEPIVLVTAEEASRPDQKIVKGMTRPPPSDGPILEFVKPADGATVNKPVEIDVNFKPKDAPVKLDSLKVTYLKLFSIDITDRVRPFATVEGIHIKEADLPTGSHKVKFAIQDEQDRLTERTLAV